MNFIKTAIATLSLLIATASVAMAQETEKVKVRGALYEKTTNEELPFGSVTVSYLNGKDTVLYRQITDKDGSFAIVLPYAKEYYLNANFIGLETYTKTIKPAAGSNTFDLGKIYMEESATMLKEATVTATRPLVKASIDRLAYDMSADPTVKTDNLLDALRKVPLVTIDGDGNIQIKGSGNYRVFLNGKPSNLFNQNAKEVLKSIPAGSIKSVEVITDPGVKYDAEGVSAILNIVTDSGSSVEGMMGTLGATITNNPIANLNGYLTAKKGKWGFTGNISGFGGKMKPMYQTTERTGSGVNNVQNTQMNVEKVLGVFGNVLISYEIDSLNLLNVNGSIQTYNMKMNSHLNEMLANKKYNMDLHQKINQGGSEVSVDYQHSTRKPGELLTLSYHFSHTPDARDIVTDRFVDGIATPLYSRLSKVDGKQLEHTAQIDYVTPIGKNHNVEAGLKYINRTSTSSPIYQYRTDINSPWIDGGVAGSLYDQSLRHAYTIGAAYLSYEYRTMLFSAKAGVRVEMGKLGVKFLQKPEADFSKKFMEWVPQVNLSYNLSQMSQLKLGYNFRVQRPSITHLNPFRMQMDEFNVETGNPNLEAARLHKVNLDYSLFGQKLSLNLSTAYEFTDNAIERYTYREGDMFYSTYGNVGKNRTTSLNGYIMYSPAMWVRAFTNFNVAYTHQESASLNVKRNVWSGSAFMGATFMLPKDWNIDATGGLFKPLVGMQQTMDNVYFYRLGVSKQFLQKRLTLSASANNFLSEYQKFKTTTYGQDFTHVMTMSHPSRTFQLGVTYTFGSMKTQVAKTRRTITNDDLAPAAKPGGQNPTSTPGM